MSARRRRTTFAAPFVVTALLVPACGGSSKATEPAAGAGTAVTVQTPNGEGTWTKTDDKWMFQYASDPGTRIYHIENDFCMSESEGTCGPDHDAGVDEKPGVESCNPPPPQEVACPPGRPGA
jgi:hypothetical protein